MLTPSPPASDATPAHVQPAEALPPAVGRPPRQWRLSCGCRNKGRAGWVRCPAHAAPRRHQRPISPGRAANPDRGLELQKRRWRLVLWVPGLGRLHAGLFEHLAEARAARDLVEQLIFDAVLPAAFDAPGPAAAAAIRVVAGLACLPSGRPLLALAEPEPIAGGIRLEWPLPGVVLRLDAAAELLVLRLSPDGGRRRRASSPAIAAAQLAAWGGHGG